MDIQFWIWLIIIVITLIARATRQKPKQQPRQEGEWEEPRSESPGQRPMSFEELLKEIQAAKEGRQTKEAKLPSAEPIKSYRQPEPIFSEVDYDDNLGEEAQDLETVVDDQRTVDTYETAKRQAFTRPSLEETMRLEDTVMKFGQFKGYESTEQPHPLAGVLQELKDPEGFKKAFIMSEILARRF